MKPSRKRGADAPNVKEIFDAWIAGYADEDVSKIMSVYHDDAIYSEPCYPNQTYSDLQSWFKFDFARSGVRPTWKYEIESMDVGGDLAVVVSHWLGYSDYGTKLQTEVRRLRSVDFFRAGPTGWAIFRTLNDPAPCGGHSSFPRKRGQGSSTRR